MGRNFTALLNCPNRQKYMYAVTSLEQASPAAFHEVERSMTRDGVSSIRPEMATWISNDLDMTRVARPSLPATEYVLHTPEDFMICFGKDVVAVDHSYRWESFLERTDLQRAIIGSIRALGSLTGAIDIIVTCDWCPAIKGFHEGLDYHKALASVHGAGAGVTKLSDLGLTVETEDSWQYVWDDPETWDYHAYWRVQGCKVSGPELEA